MRWRNSERKVLEVFRKLFCMIIFVYISVVSSAVMSISPVYFNQRIDGAGGYQEYEIGNDSYNTVRYKIDVLPDVKDKKEFERMKKWIEVYPKVLTIKPKSSGKVKVMIKADRDAKRGEYNFVVTPTPIVIPKITEKKTQEKIAVIKTETPLVLTLGIDGYVGEFGDITSGVVISREGNKLVMENSLNRKVVLDILINEKIKVWRDNITLKAGEKIVREFNEATKLVSISEAATEIEIDKISF